MAAARKLAALAMIAALAACGQAEQGPGVASAATGGATPRATGAADEVARYVEAQRAWVRCLREQGFSDVPDPDSKGHIDLSTHGGRKKTDPAWLAAQTACRHLKREVPAVLQPTRAPLTAEQIRWNREYSRCMRANGMPNWPDPGPDGTWDNADFGGEQTEQEAQANERALQICEPVMSGRPPTTYDPSRTPQG